MVVEPGNTEYEKKQLITEDEYLDALEQGAEGFVAKIGAEAVRDLLAEIDIEDLSEELRARAKIETSVHRKKNILKRLKVIEALRQSNNRPAVDDHDRRPGHSAGPAAAGAAGGRPVRDVGPERSVPARDQPQQPAQEADRDARAGGHPA